MKSKTITIAVAALILAVALPSLPSMAAEVGSASTDKRFYRYGETVESTFTTEVGLSHGPLSSWITIYRLRPLELVKGWGCYVTWVYMMPGTFHWTWNQTYETYTDCEPDPHSGEHVPPGLYVADTPGGRTFFFILPESFPWPE